MQLHSSYKNNRRLLVLIIFLALSCTGCATQGRIPVTSIATEPPTTSATPSATVTPVATATTEVIPTFTPRLPTLAPTLPGTLAPAVIPTWTPVATLPPDAALEALLTLYDDNGGCELPCWWGITPGETSWAEARTKLAPLGWMSGPYGEGEAAYYAFSFDVPETLDTLEYFGPDLGIKEGIVVGIGVNSRWIETDFDYSLAGLLQAFGSPDEIWLKVVTDVPSEPYYNIDLFYPTKGILVSASGPIQMDDTRVIICPREFRLGSFPPFLRLWDTTMNLQYQSISYSTMGSSVLDISDYHLLEEFSDDFDSEDFYATYLDPQTTICFEINSNNLP